MWDRTLIRAAALGGLAALVASVAAAADPVSLPGLPPEPSIAQLQRLLTDHATTVAAVEQHYARRINDFDVHGPALHAVIELNPDAGAIAATLDAHGQAGRGLLFGVPVLVKDNIDTADRMLTTAGSLALTGSRPPQDAFVVRRLREAGALLLGKTNLSEWANFRSTRSASGWSGRGGQTRNPYDTTRNPCGSSSGSGVAVAADFAVVAVGTETDGSVVCPSSINGIVGIKPTVGLVSRSGIIPISASQDSAGPMARSVADAATVLTVLAGYDPDDPATAVLKNQPPPDYRKFLNADISGMRVGVVRRFAGFHEGVDALLEQSLKTLRARGVVVVDVNLDLPKTLGDDENTVMQYEFKDGLNRYLSRRPSGPHTLAELIAFNQAHASEEMPWFQQELFTASQARGPLTDAAYLKAHESRGVAARAIDTALKSQQLDALVAPTMGPASVIDLVDGDHFIGGDIAMPPAVAGYPHVTVPMGLVHGLPVGLSFVGTGFSEGTLIHLAYGFEQAAHARRPPSLR